VLSEQYTDTVFRCRLCDSAPGFRLPNHASLFDSICIATTMAIGDIPPSPQAAAPQPIDIEAWTEQATAALSTVTISLPETVVQERPVAFDIPLDDHEARPAPSAAAKEGGLYRRKELVRRDSLKRREALLKGNEGSRRRQRWENGTSGCPSHRGVVRTIHAPRILRRL
jgi:hypothetical protein